MRKLLVNLVSSMLLLTTPAWALEPAKEGVTKLKLNILAFVDLVIVDGKCDITPGSEDYANTGKGCRAPLQEPGEGKPVNLCNPAPAGVSDGDLVVNEPGIQLQIPNGFAQRSNCLQISIFTNANNGAEVFVYGIQPAQQQNILRLKDIYFTIEVEKTYICQNGLEGCRPKANTCEKPKMSACWLRIHNEAQLLISINEATKTHRNIAIAVGIGNLSHYTQGEYTSDVVVVLMPKV